jgi:hypothetical protein
MSKLQAPLCGGSQARTGPQLGDARLRNNALCLQALVFESKKFQAEQLAQFGVKHSDIGVYVDELEQSFREWHHGFSEPRPQYVVQRYALVPHCVIIWIFFYIRSFSRICPALQAASSNTEIIFSTSTAGHFMSGSGFDGVV